MNNFRRSGVLLLVLELALVFSAAVAAAVEVEFLGEVRLPTGTEFEATQVGGLSGLSYDPSSGHFYAVSDDRSFINPARFYTVDIDLSTGRLAPGAVRFVAVTTLHDESGAAFASGTLDPEAIAAAGDGSFLISSEGDTARGIAPFVRRFSSDGAQLESLTLPDHYFATPSAERGVRSNLAFEGMAVAPQWPSLFVACENALLQDGPVADLGISSATRILELDLVSRRPVREYVYRVEPVPVTPQPEDAFRVNGVSEIVAIDGRLLIVVERSFSAGRGNSIRLYLASLERATNVLRCASLRSCSEEPIVEASKHLLLDLAELGIVADNIEGMSFGPLLPDGRQSLILISDNNFNAENQTNQFLAFAVSGLAPELRRGVGIAEIQGAAHRSPYEDQWLDEVPGVVTAVHEGRSGARTVWLQDPQQSAAGRSTALKLVLGQVAPTARVGDRVAASGRVEEQGFRGELSVTRMAVHKLEVLEHGLSLPAPVLLGEGGRSIPSARIDDDGLTLYEPATDAIDFFESLEGMRVVVNDGAQVVGPTSSHDEITVLADGGVNSTPRSQRGALLRTAVDLNPERLLLDDLLLGNAPKLELGQRLSGPVNGVMDYGYGAYRIRLTEALPAASEGSLARERTLLDGGPGLRIATMNLENFSYISSVEQLQGLARSLVDGLAAPPIVALQEVQDDSGRSDDGEVSAERTLARLVSAVEDAGGPRYAWRQIDPVDGADGGVPGGNIRVAFLFDPERVRFVDREPGCGGVTVSDSGVPSCSPGRLFSRNPAFNQVPEQHFFGTRKPLLGEFVLAGQRLIVINVHLSSKIGDDPLFGVHQPPHFHTEAQRTEQARLIAGFVAELLAADPEARVIVLGDFNEFEYAAPLQELQRVGLTDLMMTLPPEERYSYVYRGNAQALDHIVVSPALAAGAELDIVHRHSEFPAAQRPTDHDPLIARFATW